MIAFKAANDRNGQQKYDVDACPADQSDSKLDIENPIYIPPARAAAFLLYTKYVKKQRQKVKVI